MNEINMVEIVQNVKVRKYEIDNMKLCDLLRKHKAEVGLNNKQISRTLNVNKETVNHWFRRDEYFSIPDPNIWFQLKELLHITTDKYDAPICEFIVKPGEYDKGNRLYIDNGISPAVIGDIGNAKFVIKEKQSNQLCG